MAPASISIFRAILPGILHLCSAQEKQDAQAVGAGRVGGSEHVLSLVAGRGFEPLTFRL